MGYCDDSEWGKMALLVYEQHKSLLTFLVRAYFVCLCHLSISTLPPRTAQLLLHQLPTLQSWTLQIIDTVFCPHVILRQLVVWIALEAGVVTLSQAGAVVRFIGSRISAKSRLLRSLRSAQAVAQSQDEWMDLAERMDNVQGYDTWRSDPQCALYERDRIAARIDEYVHLMRRRDIFELMFVLRGSIGRNKFGLLQEDLFTKAMAGSKVLVETYHNVVCAALDFVCDAPVLPGEEPIPTASRLAFFNETRHAYGRTALLLSGGAALGFYHVGVVKTLMENRLMPRVLGGSSAGSLVCGMIGTRTDEECMRDLFQVKGTTAPGHSGKLILNFFRPVRKEVPEQVHKPSGSSAGGLVEVLHNTAGAFYDAKRTLQGFVPISLRRLTSFWYDLFTGNTRPQDLFKNDTEYFRDCVRASVGNFTFQEAFDRTGRILNIVVTPNNPTDPPRLLNYLTAPHVLVWSAAVASSSLPGVFEANRLVVKEADGHERYESGTGLVFSDGSMEQDLPMQQLSEMFNINHFIISQANPHAVMFASYNQKVSVWNNPLQSFLGHVIVFLKDQVRSWLFNIVSVFGGQGVSTTRGIGSQFFTQEYEGRSSDISLIPWLGHRGLFSAMLHIIYNPSEAEFREWIQAAQRETWKYIPAIKSHIAEEITLDRCVQRLRKRVVQESWEEKQRASSGDVVPGRVPSFFTSSSLVNLSGLGVSDQPTPDTTLHELRKQTRSTTPPPPTEMVPQVTHSSGWGGMGLRGNRTSSGSNLQRSPSDASGLFIDDEEHSTRQQDPGEKSQVEHRLNTNSQLRDTSEAATLPNHEGYVKTTSMARFYYRKKGGSTDHFDSDFHQTSSDGCFKQNDTAGGEGLGQRKSLSHADLDANAKR